jgi:hypothetical protein
MFVCTGEIDEKIKFLIRNSDTIALRGIFRDIAKDVIEQRNLPNDDRHTYLASLAVEVAIKNIHNYNVNTGKAVLFFYNTIDGILLRSKLDPFVEILFAHDFSHRVHNHFMHFESDKYKLYFMYDKKYKELLYNGDIKTKVNNIEELQDMLKQSKRNESITSILSSQKTDPVCD